jgi:hypothetical protein
MDQILKTVAQFFKAEWSSEGFIQHEDSGPPGSQAVLYHNDGVLDWEVFADCRNSYLWITASLTKQGFHILESHGRYSFARFHPPEKFIGGECHGVLILVPEGATHLGNISWFARHDNGRIEYESHIGFPHTPESAERLEKFKTQETLKT